MIPHRLRPYMSRQLLIYLRSILRFIYQIPQSLYCFLTMSNSNSEPEPQPLVPDTPPFDPIEPSVPVSYPIKTLHELESRSYFESFHYPFNKASVALPNVSSSLPDRRRLLVCHDMAGGYSDDKWIQGGNNPEAYAIWHWHLIDVFIYFSHSLVTLPPPCWTNAAHRHGVKVLGTFITEWDEGKAVCDELHLTKESAQMYAERLAELAVALGFDGWLINMEVNLDPNQIPNLKEFVNHLSLTMHSSVPGSLVIWYDSVTVAGKLDWQDQLNEYNKPFFDICDGIFVNYTWKEDYPRLSAEIAGGRNIDVYVGIDVFGRNTYGGGQWNANVALEVLRKAEVSAAIFAPGWVYETKQEPDFETAQNRWWGLVEKSWGLRNYPLALPFYTNFDQGRGYHISVDGEKISDTPWCNISCQGIQPFLEFVDTTSDSVQVFLDLQEASYSGGGNIKFKGSLEKNAYFEKMIFRGEILLDEFPIHLIYSVKSEGNSLLGLALEFSSSTKEKTSVLLTSQAMNNFSSKFSEVLITHVLKGCAPGWAVHEGTIEMIGSTLTEIHAVCYKSDLSNEPRLKSRSYGPNSTAAPPTGYFAVLGHITIKSSNYKLDFPPSNSWLVEGKYIKWMSGPHCSRTLSVNISWKLKDGKNSKFPNYNIYVEKLAKQAVVDPVQQYLGAAQGNCFYVSELKVPTGISGLKFIIQVCGVDGTKQKLDESPYYQLEAEDP